MLRLNSNKIKQIQWNIIGVLIGLAVGMLIGASSICEVLYVSQDEILALEHKRVAGIKEDKEKELFYGKARDAVKLIEQLVEERTKSGEVVVTSKNKIRGVNVRSISEEIHQQLVNHLSLIKES